MPRRCSRYGVLLSPIVVTVARKPLSAGTVATNVIEHETGALNIDGSRIATADDCARTPVPSPRSTLQSSKLVGGTGSPLGRWPSNLILSHEAAEHLDSTVPHTVSSSRPRNNGAKGVNTPCYGKYEPCVGFGFEDSGGNSRFFKVLDSPVSQTSQEAEKPPEKPR